MSWSLLLCEHKLATTTTKSSMLFHMHALIASHSSSNVLSFRPVSLVEMNRNCVDVDGSWLGLLALAQIGFSWPLVAEGGIFSSAKDQHSSREIDRRRWWWRPPFNIFSSLLSRYSSFSLPLPHTHTLELARLQFSCRRGHGKDGQLGKSIASDRFFLLLLLLLLLLFLK